MDRHQPWWKPIERYGAWRSLQAILPYAFLLQQRYDFCGR